MTDIDKMKRLDLGMTNFDHTIDVGLAEALRAEPDKVYAIYAAANFCSYVWFSIDGYFRVQVWVHGVIREELRYKTLEDVMSEVSEAYGYN